MTKIVISILCVLLFSTNVYSGRFLQLFSVRIGGDVLTEAQADELGLYDYILINANEYDRISYSGDCATYHSGSTTYNYIDDVGTCGDGKPQIYTYLSLLESQEDADEYAYRVLSKLDHYGSDRSGAHTGGKLEGTSKLMYDADGCCSAADECAHSGDTNRPWTNFGDATTQTWVKEAIDDIIADQDWKADGIFSDHAWSERSGVTCPSGPGTDYDTRSEWQTEMAEALVAYETHLDTKSMGLISNSGPVRYQDGADICTALDTPYDCCTDNNTGPTCSGSGVDMWDTLDSSGYDAVMEEDSFSTGAGDDAHQFYPYLKWLQTLQAMDQDNMKVFMHSDQESLNENGDSGTDNWGDPVTSEEAFWYNMTSYVLGMKSNTYFASSETLDSGGYNGPVWWDEYSEMDEGDNLHLGSALGTYESETLGGQTIYYRQFDKGCVFVNPQLSDTALFDLPDGCRPGRVLDASNYADVLSTVSEVTQLQLDSHRGVFVRVERGSTAGVSMTGVSMSN